ncbi:MAG: hypothetical protein IPF52_15590 [Saprospiraceae bacterium]|nr:hypothetical protein [Saprospiraceae bacterium]
MNGRKTGAYYFKADKVRPWEECRVNVWILSKNNVHFLIKNGRKRDTQRIMYELILIHV